MKQCYVPKRFQAGSQNIIARAQTVCDSYAAQGYDLTLRQLYYQFVSRGWIANKQSEYDRLGSIVNDARLAGLIDWDHLTDRTRNLQDLLHFEDPTERIEHAARAYRIDLWADQDFYVEVWVEKEALAGIVERVAQRNDVAFFSCRGYVSQSEMHGAGLRLKEKSDAGRSPVIIHLGDHDPSGIDMTRDIASRLALFMTDGFDACGDVPGGLARAQAELDYQCSHADLTVTRIALNMDQIRRYNPPPNPAKLALAVDTPLPTPSGWTTMGEVQVGDLLFGVDGRPYPVTDKSDVFQDKVCLEFTLAGGETIICSEDHLWHVNARGRRGGVMTSRQIADTSHEGATRRPVYRLAVACPIDTPKADLPIPPYVLGAWLGDGNSDAEGFACGLDDEELLEHIKKEGFKVARKPSYPVACTIYGLRGKLHALGVANNKHIPEAYLRADYEQRLALLQGLMDTDGTVSQHQRQRACVFGSSRIHLAEQVLELLCTLGIRGRISESRAIYDGKDCGPTWRVEFYPGDADVFRLTRKRERLIGADTAERQRWRTIINVQPAPTTLTQCLAIASPDHLYLAGKHFIPTHNTDSRCRDYMDKYGTSSWELDALDPATLGALIQSAIDRYRDTERFNAALARQEKERELLTQAGERWEEVSDLLRGST